MYVYRDEYRIRLLVKCTHYIVHILYNMYEVQYNMSILLFILDAVKLAELYNNIFE